VLDNDTLTIDKHNCGEHGFENRVFLKNGDSLKMVASYRVIPLQSEKQTVFTDLLEIAEFKREESTLKTSSESIEDWDNIKLDRPPGKFDHFRGKNSINDYLFYLDEYKKIRALGLISE
jgi:hypothetical protein